MRDRDLYAQILGIRSPWKVTEVDLDTAGETVEVHVRHEAGKVCCPECGKEGPRHDHRERRWRHLDTCQFRTILVADVPRVRCAEHGVHQIEVPWAESGSSTHTDSRSAELGRRPARATRSWWISLSLAHASTSARLRTPQLAAPRSSPMDLTTC